MNKKTKTLVVGALLGAFLGVALAWAANETINDEDDSLQVNLKATDYFQLGMSLLGLARQFSNLLGRV